MIDGKTVQPGDVVVLRRTPRSYTAVVDTTSENNVILVWRTPGQQTDVLSRTSPFWYALEKDA